MRKAQTEDPLVHNVEHLVGQGAEVGFEGVDALVARAQDGIGVLDDLERRLEPEVGSCRP